MIILKEVFGSTKILLMIDGKYAVDSPIDYVEGFDSYEDAYNYCIKFR